MTMYAIKTPGGQLQEGTLAPTKARSYDLIYSCDPFVRPIYTQGWVHEFPRRLRRAGYQCVKIVVSEA